MQDCSRLSRLVYILTTLFVAAGVFGCAATQETAPTGREAKAEEMAASGRANQGACVVAYYRLPAGIDFCGEPVPLENREVLERFDKEFTLVVHNHAQVYWWLKRKERHFPWIEDYLRRLNLPEDLKYVAIAEIEPPLNAPGRRRSADARYDFQRSPESALQYLGDLYRTFESWSLALAAYNCGEKCVTDEFRAQGKKDFYHMLLPEETERYVFRILAIKAVLSNPTLYGYELPKGH